MITILGGGGYCGHHLALALKAKGEDVTIVDSFGVNNVAQWISDTGLYRERYLGILNERLHLLRAADIPFYTMDCRQYHGLSQVLDRLRPSRLVHLCALAHAGRSNADRHAAWEHTLVTLKNALDYAI